MTGAADLARMVPGFDFLQGLVKNAGGGLPDLGQWVAPTLKPEEIDKRISELKTVQFWLEQNAKLLAASIQALEVQRMTLATLKTMNVPLDRMRDAFMLTPQTPAAAAAPAPSPAPEAALAPAPAPAPAPPAVDPVQWWGALTQQFTELASKAMKDSSSQAAQAVAETAIKPARKAAAKKPKR